jgi:hypothetical protein
MFTRSTLTRLLALGSILAADSAFGWSSPSSQTYHDLWGLDRGILLFHAEKGRYPDPKHLRQELQDADIRDPDSDIRDRWGREFIYRLPGEHGPYDLYSAGPDGVDDRGAGDDISMWAGVNEGFHWKRNWPRGRRVLVSSILVGLFLLPAGYWLRWRFILPFAGVIVSLGIVIGCHLLLHPGVVPSRNNPLLVWIVLASVLLVISAVACALSLRPPPPPQAPRPPP